MKMENSVANTTAIANSLSICPAIPDMVAIGMNTATFVSVDATTATTTSSVPVLAADFPPSPIFLWWKMFSRMTTEFITSTPTAVDIPISDMMFNVNPIALSAMNVGRIESGMVMATMMVERKEWRKNSSMMAVNPIPIIMLDMVSFTVLLVTDAVSDTTYISTPSGSSDLMSSMSSFICFSMATAFPSEVLEISISTERSFLMLFW